MKRINKVLHIILIILMLIFVISVTASASTSGACGNNLVWDYDSSSFTLTISGTGDMDSYAGSNRPWESYVDEITSIVISHGVTSVGSNAFLDCRKITSISLPDTIDTIEEFAFSGTGLYNNGMNWEDDVLYINNHLVSARNSLSGTYIVKDGTKTIADKAFYLCKNIQSVIIPDSVTTIGCNAFNNCWALQNVTIGNGVESIGDYAFFNCDALDNIVLSESLKYIGSRAFDMCDGFTNFSIPAGVTSIGNDAFNYCTKLVSITVDSDNQYYSSDAFGVLFDKDKAKLIEYPMSNNRTEYTIPDSVDEIGMNAFYPCKSLISIGLGDGVRIIRDSAFAYCTSVVEIIIPDGATAIGEQAFYGCSSLANVVIGDGVETIGHSAFYNSGLYSVTIPKSVKKIGYTAFEGCSKLTEVHFNGSAKQWDDIVIDGGNECLLSATIYFNECAHDFICVVTEPTCTQKGYTTYTCECGESYVDDYINEIGHVSSTAVEENCIAPTCIENGSKDVVVYCSVCEAELDRENVVVDAKGHVDNDADECCDECAETLDPVVNDIWTEIEKIIQMFLRIFKLMFEIV